MKLKIVYYIFVKNKYKICENKENVVFYRFLRSFSAKELSNILLLCYNRRKLFRRRKTKEEASMINQFLEFLENSYTAYQAAENARTFLIENGVSPVERNGRLGARRKRPLLCRKERKKHHSVHGGRARQFFLQNRRLPHGFSRIEAQRKRGDGDGALCEAQCRNLRRRNLVQLFRPPLENRGQSRRPKTGRP